MAHGPVMFCKPAHDLLNFLHSGRDQGSHYLMWVTDLVSRYKGRISTLKHPAGATWTIGDLDDTIYKDTYRTVNGWGKFYLRDSVNMKVVGVAHGTAYPCDQLVLMTCEDQKLYAYDGEELHEVASSLEELCMEGISYPASRSYYHGEAFKNMTEQDWDKVKKGPVGKSLDEAHHKLVTSGKSRFLENLNFTGV